MADVSKTGSSVLTSRKSSSTPSLPDATENHAKTSVASTEQAASADNLAAKVYTIISIVFTAILKASSLSICNMYEYFVIFFNAKKYINISSVDERCSAG